jgi:hypothetical protein
MKSRVGGNKRACHYCGTPTKFIFQQHGEGRWLDVCPPCGESPARRAEFIVAAREAKRKKKEAA